MPLDPARGTKAAPLRLETMILIPVLGDQCNRLANACQIAGIGQVMRVPLEYGRRCVR